MPRQSKSDILPTLRALVDAEAPAAGDRLPTERKLASRLGCSRQTLRAALDELQLDGTIWRRVGTGTFRGPPPRGQPIRDTLLVEATSPRQLMEARLAIEPQIAATAALRAQDDDVDMLRRLVANGRAGRDRAACERDDERFHLALAGMAGNPILYGVLVYLSGARRRAAWQREWDRTYRRIGVGEFTGRHSDQHAGIVDAIAAADAAAARDAMRGHLETIEAAMNDAAS